MEHLLDVDRTLDEGQAEFVTEDADALAGDAREDRAEVGAVVTTPSNTKMRFMAPTSSTWRRSTASSQRTWSHPFCLATAPASREDA